MKAGSRTGRVRPAGRGAAPRPEDRDSIARTAAFAGIAAWLLAALLLSLASIQDPDLGFHIAWGRILADRFGEAAKITLGQDPAVTVYAYSYWLYQMPVAWIYDHLGSWAIVALRAAVVMTTLALALHAALRLRAPAWATALVLAVCVPIMHERFVDRPDVVSHLFWMAALWILLFHRGGRGVWALVPLQALWVNVHLYFVLLPVLHLLFALGDHWERRGSPRRAALVLGALVLATFLNPAGPFAWASQLELATFFAGRRFSVPLQELLSPYATPQPWTSTWVFRFAMPALLLGALAGRRRIGAGAVLALAFAALLGALAQRWISLFGLTALALAPAALGAAIERRSTALSALRAGLVAVAALAGLAAVVGLANGRLLLAQDKSARIPDLGPPHFPALAAARFLRTEGVQGPIFHNPISAGAILLENGDRLTPFMDPRWTPTERAGAGYRRLIAAGDHDVAAIWQEIQGSRPFEVVMLDFYEMPALLRHLGAAPEWPLVYSDDGAAVFCRRGGANRAVIARWEPRLAVQWARPDTAREAALAREVLRVLRSPSPSFLARLEFPWESFRRANFALRVSHVPEAQAAYLELFRRENGSLHASRHRADILGNVLACLAESERSEAREAREALVAALTRR